MLAASTDSRELGTGKQLSALLAAVINTSNSKRLLGHLIASSKEPKRSQEEKSLPLRRGGEKEEVALLTSGGLWHYST